MVALQWFHYLWHLELCIAKCMSKAVFLCVGTGGHVLPVINLIESMSNKGIDNTKFLVVTDKGF